MSLYNSSNSSNFVLEIPDAGLTKAFKANVTSGLIPGVRTSPIEVPSGTMGIGRAKIPSSTMEFDPLVIGFLVDENLETWLELYQWMLSVNNYITLNSTAWKDGNVPEFITMHLLDNTKSSIVLSIHYYGAFCSDIGEIEFSYTESGDIAMKSTATFNYKYFLIEKNGIIIDSKKSIEEFANTQGKSN